MKLNVLSDDFFEELASQLNISETAFNSAEGSYKAIGKIFKDYFNDFKIHVYPQGSTRLGTAIKPINENDDYDLDVVCEFLGDYFKSAEDLKKSVGKVLEENDKYNEKLKEGKRCWTLEYADSARFHMDILPCKSSGKANHSIDITNKENGKYEYKSSNPFLYADWFDKKQEKEIKRELIKRNITFSKDCKIDDLKKYGIRTTLQKAIQILKRHRDMTYINATKEELEDKPISIIITTLVSYMYTGEESISELIYKFITRVDEYLKKDSDGNYIIKNPVDNEENFADKWKTYPSRKEAFFNWINKLKKDLILSTKLLSDDKVVRFEHLKEIFGNTAINNIMKKEHLNNIAEINYIKPNQDDVITFSKNQEKNSLEVKEHSFYD